MLNHSELPPLITETDPSPENGKNVFLQIDLLRHPEKEYSTGKLTEQGKAALVDKLDNEYTEGEFDTVKCYVSPLSRGQESMEPLGAFLRHNDISTTVRTKDELAGRATEAGQGLKAAVGKLVNQEQAVNESTSGSAHLAHSFEPPTKDFETAANELLIRDFFNKNFPDSPISGEDIGKEVDTLLQHFAKMAKRLHSESRVKLILISHSGIIEHLIKLIYLKNNPSLKPEEVSVEDIGGLINYASGPTISINSDGQGRQAATLKFKDMVLNYDLT